MGNVVPVRTEEATVAFGDLPEPDSYRIARLSGTYLSIPLIVYNLVVGSLVLRPLLQSRSGAHVQPVKARRFQRILLGNIAFSTMLATLQLAAASWEGVSWETCTYLGSSYAPLYIMSNFFVYLCLFERVQTVGNRMGQSLGDRVMLVLVRTGIYFVPVMALGAFFLFQGRLYFAEQTCVQSVVAWLAWLSLSLDTTLSLALLFMFLRPVLYYLRRITSQSNDAAMDQKAAILENVARQNLWYSMVAILSTLVYLTAICSTTEVLSRRETPDTVWMRHIQSNGIVLELGINTTMILLMTSAVWMPRSLGRRLNACCMMGHRRRLKALESASSLSNVLSGDQGLDDGLATSVAVLPPQSGAKDGTGSIC